MILLPELHSEIEICHEAEARVAVLRRHPAWCDEDHPRPFAVGVLCRGPFVPAQRARILAGAASLALSRLRHAFVCPKHPMSPIKGPCDDERCGLDLLHHALALIGWPPIADEPGSPSKEVGP